MNKNIIVVGAIAAGLYLLSQGKKTIKAVVKKKTPRRPPRKYHQPHPYLKPKIKRVIARKKAIYNKPKTKRVIARKKSIYNKPRPRIAVWKKQIIKRMARRKRRR